jgi:cobalt/nickel transport protein
MANSKTRSTQGFVLLGLAAALLIAVFLSPFASSNPDGLDRVSQDHGFNQKAQADPIAKRLPFFAVFEEYAVRGVPKGIATPLAGLFGTLVTFGIAWSAGKLLVKGEGNSSQLNSSSDPSDSDRA